MEQEGLVAAIPDRSWIEIMKSSIKLQGNCDTIDTSKRNATKGCIAMPWELA